MALVDLTLVIFHNYYANQLGLCFLFQVFAKYFQ